MTWRKKPVVQRRMIRDEDEHDVMIGKGGDADEGLNGHIRYTIVSGDKTTDFSIGEYSGVIKVNKKLDFERKNA